MSKNIQSLALVRVLAVVMVFILAACAGTGPQAREFSLEIKDGKLTKGSAAIKVNQDDTVTMKVATDKPVTVHLHGYDIEKQATPEEPAVLSFTANATGRFIIEIEGYRKPEEKGSHDEPEKRGTPEAGHDDEDEKVIGTLEVSPR